MTLRTTSQRHSKEAEQEQKNLDINKWVSKDSITNMKTSHNSLPRLSNLLHGAEIAFRDSPMESEQKPTTESPAGTLMRLENTPIGNMTLGELDTHRRLLELTRRIVGPSMLETTPSRSTAPSHNGPMKRKRKSNPKVIEEANQLTQPLFTSKHIPAGYSYYIPQSNPQRDKRDRNLAYEVRIKCSPNVKNINNKPPECIATKDQLDDCFKIIESTSREAYFTSSFGWNPHRKKREMRESNMRYLLVTEQSFPERAHAADSAPNPTRNSEEQPLAGFCSFMLCHEDGFEVTYIYEIHLRPSALGKGLGKHLLSIVEHVGRSVGVEKSMLTVFRSNQQAIEIYEHLGYGRDEYSPQAKVFRDGTVKEVDYLIMSKRLMTAESDEGSQDCQSSSKSDVAPRSARDLSKRQKR